MSILHIFASQRASLQGGEAYVVIPDPQHAPIPPAPQPLPVAAQPAAAPAPKEARNTMITFKSIGHFFAKAFQSVVADIPKIEATAGTVETVSALIPTYGPLAVTVEKAGYAALGELASVLSAGGAAAEAKLADAGLDANVVATVKALLSSIPQLVSMAKSL